MGGSRELGLGPADLQLGLGGMSRARAATSLASSGCLDRRQDLPSSTWSPMSTNHLAT
jgi:hypothetical protein